MKAFKFVRCSPLSIGWLQREMWIYQGDIILLLARIKLSRIIMIPSGSIHVVSWQLETDPDFVEVCP